MVSQMAIWEACRLMAFGKPSGLGPFVVASPIGRVSGKRAETVWWCLSRWNCDSVCSKSSQNHRFWCIIRTPVENIPSWDFNNDLKFDDFWIRPCDHFCQDGDSHFLKRNPPRTPPGNRCKHGYDFNLIGVHAILHHATCRQRFLGGVRGGSRLNQNRCLKSIGLY